MQINNTVGTLKVLALLLMSPLTFAQSAFEHKQGRNGHESKAHVHGQADLNLNVQDDALNIELVIPAVDAVGFEHHPHTQLERNKIQSIATLLKKVDSWVVPAPEALCTLKSSTLVQPYGSENAGATEVGRDADEHNAAHSDFIITAEWQCAKANNVSKIHLGLFDQLPDVQTINVKWIKNGTAGVAKLTAGSRELFLSSRER